MKYHSPFSTIVISVILVLLFAAVSIFTVLFFGIASPTEIIVQDAIASFTTADPDISLSYSSIDRKLSEGVTINDVKVNLRDKSILEVDKVTVEKGIVSIFKELFSDDTYFEFKIRNPKVMISMEDFDTISDILSKKGSSESPAVEAEKDEKPAKKMVFDLDFEDLEFLFDDMVHLPGCDAIVRFDTASGLVSAEADIRKASVSYGDIGLTLNDLKLRCNNVEGEYKVKLSLDETDFKIQDYLGTLDAFAFDTTFSLDSFSDLTSIPFKLGAVSLVIEDESDELYVKSLPFSVTSDGKKIEAGFNKIYASFDKYAIALESLSAGLDIPAESASLSVDNVILYQETQVIGSIDSFNAGLSDDSVEVDLASIVSDYTDSITEGIVSNILVSDVGIKLIPMENGGKIRLGTRLEMASGNKLLDGITTDLDAVIAIDGKDISSAELSMDNLMNDYLLHPIGVAASYGKDGISIDVHYGEKDLLSVEYRDALDFTLKFDELKLSEFLPILDEVVPEIDNYIADETILNGRVNLVATRDDNARFKITGPLDYAFALSGINFNGMSFNVGSTLNSHIGSSMLDVDSFILTSDYVKLRYSGKFDLEQFLPEGDLSLELSSTGAEIFDLNVTLNELKQYAFNLDIPMLGKTNLEGKLDFADGRFFSEATLRSFSTDYAFQLDLDLNTRNFDLNNDNSNVHVNWEEGIDAIASFDHFALPVGGEDIMPCTLSGDIKVDFDFSSQKYRAYTKDFHIENMRHLPLDPSLVFSMDFEDGMISVYDALFKTEKFPEMTGNAFFDFKTKEIAVVFKSSDELVQFSSTGIEDYYSGLFSVTDYNLQRLGFDDGVANLSLVGRGRDLNSLSFSGGFNVRGSDMINNPLEMSGELYVNKDTFSITDLNYKKGSMVATCNDILFSTTEGRLSVPISLDIVKQNKDRDYPISLELLLSMEMDGQKDFYSLFKELAKDDFEKIDFGISLRNFNLDDKFLIDELSSTFKLKNGSLLFDGELLSGILDLNRMYADIDLNLDPIGAFAVKGTFAPEFNLDATVKYFNVSSINCLFVSPVVVFGPQSIAYGGVTISGKLGDIHMYGDVWADRVDVNVLWVPDDDLIAHNVHFVIWDNNMKTAMTAVTAVNKDTLARRDASVVCEFNFLPSFGFDYYQIDCYVPDGNEVSFRLPLLQQNLDMKGLVSGWFQVRQEGANDVIMDGKANCDDFIVSIGLAEYPHWVEVNPDKRSSFTFDLLLRQNFKFVYPLGPNPIITAFAAENQNLKLWFDEGKGFGASGSVGLRAGEIFYFQKNFLITEGNIELRESETSMIDPVINLRAQLRDFDQNGDKVDIYLILRDATLANFNPIFESSPAKDINEIMSILGQSIISKENQGTLNSVVHLVSTGVDALNRIGFLSMGNESDTFRKSIRTSLNLDTFSLHTNIIENLVFDAVGLVQNSGGKGLSPLASYLDGTTLYMGKYLTTDIYLGAMVHLSADRSGGLDNSRKSFLTSDLTLDTEISIEWDNPLCNFRFFTRPSSINAFEIFDTMGFSLTRRFVF